MSIQQDRQSMQDNKHLQARVRDAMSSGGPKMH